MMSFPTTHNRVRTSVTCPTRIVACWCFVVWACVLASAVPYASRTAIAQPTVQNVAGETKGKVSAPDAATAKQALDRVRQTFAQDIAAATTNEQKQSLAQKLTVLAGRTSDDNVGRFAILTLARGLATDAGDATTAIIAVDSLTDDFDLDGLPLKKEIYLRVVRVLKTPQEFRTLWRHMDAAVDQALSVDDYAAAKQFAAFALNAASRGQESSLNALSQQRVQEVGQTQRAFAAFQQALGRLELEPDDADANLKVGSFRCFVKGDWGTGLPLLAKGADEKLAALAARELAATAQAEAIAIGDGWWEAAQSRTRREKEQAQRHAAAWYTRALTNAEGLTKATVEQRLGEIDRLNGWTTLFRSDDANLWNTAVRKDNGHFAVPVAQAPDDTRYLRLSRSRDEYVLLTITKQQLSQSTLRVRYGWDGSKAYAKRLGIFDVQVEGGINGTAIGVYNNRGYRGWGFGYYGAPANPIWEWRTVQLPPTVMEIAVKSGVLTREEFDRLLE